MAVKICLDAGHYGKYNQSPAVKTYYESEMNWQLHLLLKKYLEDYGIEVTQTRLDQKKDLDLYLRGQCGKGCDLLLSLHSNAVGSQVNESVDYPVAYVSINGKGDELGKKLAKCVREVMDTVQKEDCWSKKGTKGDYDWYSVIHGATDAGTIGIILEHSFHTNTRSTKWLQKAENLDKLARAEADLLAAHFGVEKPKPKRKRHDDKMTKQELRRKYKGVDIYLTNITQGIVNYQGKNMMYHWENTGDVEVVTIDDIVNMPKKYLHAPWLVIDGYENGQEIIDDIVEVLKLEPVYEYIDTIHDSSKHTNLVSLRTVNRLTASTSPIIAATNNDSHFYAGIHNLLNLLSYLNTGCFIKTELFFAGKRFAA